MTYIVHTEITPEVGAELESNPKVIQELIAKWQAHKPIGHYFGVSRRSMTVILEADNEDSLFEALHATWHATKSYPGVTSVADIEGFPKLLQRAGIVG